MQQTNISNIDREHFERALELLLITWIWTYGTWREEFHLLAHGPMALLWQNI